MRTFTESFLEKLAASPLPDRDAEIVGNNGLSVRRRAKSGAISFQSRYKHGARSRRLTIGRWPELSLKDALKIAKGITATVATGADPIHERRAAEAKERAQTSFSALAEAYVEFLKAKGAHSARNVENRVKRDLLPFLGQRKAAEVTQHDIFCMVEAVRQRGAHVAANRTYSLLRTVLRYGLSRGDLVIDPCARIARRHITTPEGRRTRVLSDPEIQRLFSDDDTAAAQRVDFRLIQMLRLLLLTGVRVSELRLARLTEFDLDNGTWEIPAEHAKNGKAHLVYLSAQAAALAGDLIATAEALESQYVMVSFMKSAAGPVCHRSVEWNAHKVFKAAGIEGATIHDLRRTFRTLLSRLGVAADIGERALGHRIPDLIERYDQHDYAPQLRSAAEKVGNYIDGLTSGKVIAIGTAKKSA